MSGLSLMQTRSFIDKLGDLDNEITKVCRAAEVLSKGAGKDSASGVQRLKEACDSLEDKQKFLRKAKEALLGFDGFLHAQSASMRDHLANPRVGGFIKNVGERMGPAMEEHVRMITEEVTDGIRRVTSAVAALRDSKRDKERAGMVKESVQALEKVCKAAESAISKAMDMAENPPKIPEPGEENEAEPEIEETEEEVMVEKAAGEIGFHGYTLTAESLVPGNKSKGPKELGEEDMGWVPGHRTTQAPVDEDKDEKEAGKKKATNSNHGYVLTAGLPPEFLENAQKKKDEAAAKKDGDEDDEKKAGKKKAQEVTVNILVTGGDQQKVYETVMAAFRQADSKDPDPSMMEEEPGEDTEGEPVVDKSAHGYVLTEPADHGYNLTA